MNVIEELRELRSGHRSEDGSAKARLVQALDEPGGELQEADLLRVETASGVNVQWLRVELADLNGADFVGAVRNVASALVRELLLPGTEHRGDPRGTRDGARAWLASVLRILDAHDAARGHDDDGALTVPQRAAEYAETNAAGQCGCEEACLEGALREAFIAGYRAASGDLAAGAGRL